jgi:DNA-directed RNA polymerase specialized sigma24 family protein
MGFQEDLERVRHDPAIRGLALQRAGSRELAEDALQETYWNVAQREPEAIGDLRAYFCTALVHEIGHQRTRRTPTPVEDINSAVDQESASPGRNPPRSVEHEAEIRRLGENMLSRLDSDREELMATVPRRSPDQRRYRAGILAAARAIFLLLVEGYVTSADWNAVLGSAYSAWFAESGLAADAKDQRLSRGRYDVRMLLQRLLPRDDLG